MAEPVDRVVQVYSYACEQADYDVLQVTGVSGEAIRVAPVAALDEDVLVVANEFGPNSLDIHTGGANRPS